MQICLRGRKRFFQPGRYYTKAGKNIGRVENDERFQVAGNQVCLCVCICMRECVRCVCYVL